MTPGLGFFATAGGAGGRQAIAAYFGGGRQSSSTLYSTVDKFLFADDSRSTLGTGLSLARRGAGGFANSGIAGYFAGGNSDNAGTYNTTVDKFAFPSDTRTTLGTGLSYGATTVATSNSGVAGYVAFDESDFGALRDVDKFTYPSDTRSLLSSKMPSTAVQYKGAASNTGVAGYYTNKSRIDKLVYSNETTSTISTGLSFSGTRGGTGMCDMGTSAYLIDKTFYKINLANDSVSSLGILQDLSAAGASANTGVAGYVAGGTDTNYRATTYKYAFPSDTRTTLAAGLSVARENIGGMSDEGQF